MAGGRQTEEAIAILRRLLGSPDLIKCLVNQDASGSTSSNVSVNNENERIV